jgi:hypothetical protein
MAGNEVEETARAVQGVAKWGADATQALREFGGFLARMFGGTWEQAGGLLEDHLRFRRLMNRMDFVERFEARRAQMGITGPLKSVSLKFGLPFLEAVSVEDDPTIRQMMATLLANATDETRGEEPRVAFVDIVKALAPLDARVLVAAYRTPNADPRAPSFRTILTGGLPDRFYGSPDGIPSNPPKPSPEVEIALWNLVRLGCLSAGGGFGGVSSVTVATITALGLAFVEATTLPEEREPFQPVQPATECPPNGA